jgi:hypothetical protein
MTFYCCIVEGYSSKKDVVTQVTTKFYRHGFSHRKPKFMGLLEANPKTIIGF